VTPRRQRLFRNHTLQPVRIPADIEWATTRPEGLRKERPLRVLVIDDEQDILALCGITLAHAGHDVLQACDADEGMRLARDERPDLILLDVMLPRRDGFSILEELVATPSIADIPVVMLTARSRPQDRARGWRAGASGYVTKPFTPATLNETVRVVAGMSTQEREAVRAQALSAVDSATDLDQRADAAG
jgi:two-component system, OmpR family, alkaline phosphatase synthesis response regulator PhoP